jgi:hypothetical protein
MGGERSGLPGAVAGPFDRGAELDLEGLIRESEAPFAGQRQAVAPAPVGIAPRSADEAAIYGELTEHGISLEDLLRESETQAAGPEEAL